MPEHEINGGEIWLNPDEEIAKIVDIGIRRYLGLITTRKDGLIYASVFRLSDKSGYRFDVPQWRHRIEPAVCDSMAAAEEVIREFQRSKE